MNFKERLKTFFELDLKKFIWYAFTEPFRIIWTGVISLKKSLGVVQRIQAWMFIFIILTIISALTGNVTAVKGFGICFLITLVHHEWKRGMFRKRWKDKEKKRIIRIIRKREAKQNGRSNTVREGQPSNTIRDDSNIVRGVHDREEDSVISEEVKGEEEVKATEPTGISENKQ